MLIDNLISFSTTAQAVTSSNVASTNVIDLLGAGSGNASTNIIGNVTTFSADMGIGKWKQQIYILVGTAFTTSDSCTLTINLQVAPDNGSNSPGTYQTIAATGALTAAQLVANAIIKMDWPPTFPVTERQRFVRLQYVPSATMTAGTIGPAYITTGRPDFQSMQQASPNYVVA
jgi:hypothetical protein